MSGYHIFAKIPQYILMVQCIENIRIFIKETYYVKYIFFRKKVFRRNIFSKQFVFDSYIAEEEFKNFIFVFKMIVKCLSGYIGRSADIFYCYIIILFCAHKLYGSIENFTYIDIKFFHNFTSFVLLSNFIRRWPCNTQTGQTPWQYLQPAAVCHRSILFLHCAF